jgi:cellulose synthase/poly-beta-1,6-N-acetylglucosamine synthase-like glycosyltransferase
MMEHFLNISMYLMYGCAVIYAVQIIRWAIGVASLMNGTNTHRYTIDIIIAARNEEKNIRECIISILGQEYPYEKYKITIINDQSTDNTEKIVNELIKEYPERISILTVSERPKSISPKINALTLGIKKTNNEIILTTDADCFVTKNWLSSTIKYFSDDVGITSGLTLYENRFAISDLLFGIQFLDFLSHTSVGAGSIGIGAVNSTNGSNMAFRRSAYTASGGFEKFENINSGEDSLLAQRIVGTKQWKARFVASKSFVTTFPAASWKTFLHQRMRWVGQTSEYRFGMMFFMISTFIFYLIMFISIPLSLYFGEYLMLIPIGIKFFSDFILLFVFLTRFSQLFLLRYFIPAAVIHIPFTLLAVFGGYFSNFEWKDQKVSRSNN